MRKISGLFVINVTATALATGAMSVAMMGPADAVGVRDGYQGAISTTITITSTPSATQGQCVSVNVAVTSDAGTPRGTVTFSVDAAAHLSRTLPASGILSEVLGCSSAPLARALAIGPHTLAAAFVPTGNWAPSQATSRLTILAAGTTPAGGGLPRGVDAGLTNFPASSASGGADFVRPAVSGLAVLAAMGVIAGYRRRQSRS